MDWALAVEKNHGALRRILAMLVAMVGMTNGGAAASGHGDGGRQMLPRHLHRYVLRLLRPAEAATRRLIIVAARSVVVKLPASRERKPSPKKPPLNRKNGYGSGMVIRPGPLPEWVKALAPKRSPNLSLPLLDPFRGFGFRRQYAGSGATASIRLLGDDPVSPLFRRSQPSLQPPSTSDDPLDAVSIYRRLGAIGRALDDLPGQAMRMARWQARQDARLASGRDENSAKSSQVTSESDASPNASHGEAGSLVCGRSERFPGLMASGKRRFQRSSPMRPGRPPGWRKKPDHDAYEVLEELHGLAVWARERSDSS